MDGNEKMQDNETYTADEPQNAQSGAEGAPDPMRESLPVRADLFPPGNAAPQKRARRGALPKVVSALISVVFCGTSLLYMTLQSVDLAKRFALRDASSLMLADVYGNLEKGETPEEEFTGPPAPEDAPVQT